MKEVINYMAIQMTKVVMVTAIFAGIMIPALNANAATMDTSGKANTYCTYGEVNGAKPFKTIAVNQENTAALAVWDIPAKCAGYNSTYSLVVYTAPDASLRPLSSQRYFASTTKTFAAGQRNAIGVAVPKCGFYQIDLVKGDVIKNIDDNGNSYAPHGRLITALGHTTACPTPVTPAPTTPTPTPTPETPTTPGDTTVVIDSHDETTTTTNTTTNTSTPPATTTVSSSAPATLPNTGPGSVIAAFFGASTLSAAAYQFVIRKLKFGQIA